MEKTSKKIILALASLVLLSAWCSKQPAQVNNVNPPAPAASDNTPVPQVTKPDTKQIKVTQNVYENGKKITGTFMVPEGGDALMLLRSFRKVETKTYTGVGDFVTSIDGITPDSQHFWKFYVNGKSSNVGAGSYKIKDKDVLEWRLDIISAGE